MTGGENRRRSILKALRKKRLANNVYTWLEGERGYYSNLHQYSKNKIHCSCPVCSAKTNSRGKSIPRFKRIVPGVDYKISDVKKIQRLDYEEE